MSLTVRMAIFSSPTEISVGWTASSVKCYSTGMLVQGLAALRLMLPQNAYYCRKHHCWSHSPVFHLQYLQQPHIQAVCRPSIHPRHWFTCIWRSRNRVQKEEPVPTTRFEEQNQQINQSQVKSRLDSPIWLLFRGKLLLHPPLQSTSSHIDCLVSL